MSDKLQNRLRARRAFLKGAGGAAALAAGSGLVPGFLRKLLGPSEAQAATLAEALQEAAQYIDHLEGSE